MGFACWTGCCAASLVLNAVSTHLSLEFRLAAGEEWSMLLLINLGLPCCGAAPPGCSLTAWFAILVKKVDVLTGAGALAGVDVAGFALELLLKEYLLGGSGIFVYSLSSSSFRE